MLCILCRHNLLGDCLAELRLRLCCTAMLAMRCYPAGTGLADMHVNMKGVQRPVEETIFPNTMLEKRVVINSSVVAKQPSWQESHRSRCCPSIVCLSPRKSLHGLACQSATRGHVQSLLLSLLSPGGSDIQDQPHDGGGGREGGRGAPCRCVGGAAYM